MAGTDSQTNAGKSWQLSRLINTLNATWHQLPNFETRSHRLDGTVPCMTLGIGRRDDTGLDRAGFPAAGIEGIIA
ncbi:hypothetical protein SL003B_2744 [Polymorphum gilvum SL003B-26A1]|uniref:Uncharacterized protein n=1 Tax=Polymorphum gilvum (strain LMG 25793 / CGMCC 1.9160 / SL003B-26A1) TaxID=991905 RepID=F2J5A8_POLGS|nr:hypothetical protein SL003B_2744 [Polymorphum gilvum SL003B-26A1]